MLLYMFRTVFPSITRSSRLYIQQQVHVIQVRLLLASAYEMERSVTRVIYTKNHCYQPGTFLGITPVSSVSNGLYFLTLPLVSVTRVIYTSKGMSKRFGVRVTH
jgi:hypothetical protein